MSHYDHFTNCRCEYFPCHKNVAKEDFNCLFCYCPLYSSDCGGNYTLTADGIKDCTDCTFPHERKNYAIIVEKLRQEKV